MRQSSFEAFDERYVHWKDVLRMYSALNTNWKDFDKNKTSLKLISVEGFRKMKKIDDGFKQSWLHKLTNRSKYRSINHWENDLQTQTDEIDLIRLTEFHEKRLVKANIKLSSSCFLCQ